MTAQPLQGEAFALADAFFAECQVVARFIDEKVRLQVDQRVGAVPHGVVFQGQMLRAIAWLRSLGKLNHPGDFQAVTAAARALFEGAVDLTLCTSTQRVRQGGRGGSLTSRGLLGRGRVQGVGRPVEARGGRGLRHPPGEGGKMTGRKSQQMLRTRKRMSARSRSRRGGVEGECIIPPPVPVEALPLLTFNSPARKERFIHEYVESQAKDGKVKYAEMVAVETVFGRRHEVWDVHTDKERWWVVTEPANLCPQALFPSLDCTLTFHVGLMARVAARQRGPRPTKDREKLAAAWRPWTQAADALDEADEAEEFQAVGMRCRESLLQVVRALAEDRMVPVNEQPPKRADFIRWSELAADDLAGGSSAADVRGYLKALSRSAWQFVNWLTHASNASRPDAELAVAATEAVLVAFATAVLRAQTGRPDRCPRCRSYAVVAEEAEGSPPMVSCETCGWSADAAPAQVQGGTRP